MLIDEGDKILATIRRLFESEYPRFFLGVVESATEHAARVVGHVYVWDAYRNNVVKREGRRRELIPLSSPHFTLTSLDRELDLEVVGFQADTNGRIWLVNGDATIMELAERVGGSH